MIIRVFLLAALALSSPGLPLVAHAESSIFGGSSGLDPSFCKQHAIRQTVIYVDETILVTDHTEWAVTIYNKLKATLIPGERVTLVDLAPFSGQSAEIWSGCWPAYTPEQTAQLSVQSHLFSTGPLEKLKDQQNYFSRDFGIAAEKIEKKGQRPAAVVMIDASRPPRKSIIRSLTSDDARYSHAENTIRSIIYSDLAENSDLGSVFKPQGGPAVNYGEKLGSYMRRSVFYVFGMGTDIKGDGSLQDSIRSFWDATLRSMAANIGGFGTDLNVPNIVPTLSRAYNVSLNESGQLLVGRLSLLADSEGTLVDSWIGITRLRSAAINGTYRCAGAVDMPDCTLDVTTAGGVVTTSQSETIGISSHGDNILSGTIGVQGSNVNLQFTATPVPD